VLTLLPAASPLRLRGAVILVNKTELISADQLGQVTAVLRKLNGDAAIAPTSFCNVPLTTILNTRLFNVDKAKEAAGWLKELRCAADCGRTAYRTQLTASVPS